MYTYTMNSTASMQLQSHKLVIPTIGTLLLLNGGDSIGIPIL